MGSPRPVYAGVRADTCPRTCPSGPFPLCLQIRRPHANDAYEANNERPTTPPSSQPHLEVAENVCVQIMFDGATLAGVNQHRMYQLYAICWVLGISCTLRDFINLPLSHHTCLATVPSHTHPSHTHTPCGAVMMGVRVCRGLPKCH